MLSNSWSKTEGESISQKVMSRVKPDEPLKNKINFAQKKLEFQISKLDGINEKLQKKHDMIFEFYDSIPIHRYTVTNLICK